MGAYASGFQEPAGDRKLVATFSNPSKTNWITAHAAATDLAVVEVERLWLRFEQLGANTDGMLAAENLQKLPLYNDIFVKNILTTLKSSSDGQISFQTFLNAMKWCENAELEDKLKGMFSLINSGRPVQKDLFGKVLKRIYVDESDESLQNMADVFFQQMDDKHQGFIEEKQFVHYIVNSIPKDTVDALLDFSIIPAEINEEGHRQFSAAPVSAPPGSVPPSTGASTGNLPVEDATLQSLAAKMVKRDWYILANKLGFTTAEIGEFEEDYKARGIKTQVYQMLKAWKTREGANATNRNLEQALKDSGMTDLAADLRQ